MLNLTSVILFCAEIMNKRKSYALIFILILSGFIITPTIQTVVGDHFSIVNINEIPEEDKTQSISEEKLLAKDFRNQINIGDFLAGKLRDLYLHQLRFYESPILSMPTPPPEFV